MDTLTKTDWLDLALRELAAHGYGALKAQRLAKRLSVTRGSFYYHFDSLDAFNAAVIEHWTQQTTEPLIADLDRSDRPEVILEDLLQRTLRSGEALERAVRSWATVDPRVADMVEAVDLRRIRYAEALLHQIGIGEAQALARARLLYWAAIGRLMMPYPDRNVMSDADIRGLAALMARQGPPID